MKLNTTFFYIVIYLGMIQLIASCVQNKTDNIIIDWKSVNLPADSMGNAHIGLAGPITGKIGNTILIGGGANFPDKKPWEGGKKQFHREMHLYQWASGQLEYKNTILMPFSLAYAACYSKNDVIYVVGGENDEGIQNQVYAFRLEDDDLKIDSLPKLPHPSSNGAVVCLGQSLYYIGGDYLESTSEDIWKLNLNDNIPWKYIKKMPQKLSHSVVVAHDYNLFILGGRYRKEGDISPFSDNIYKFNTHDNEITSMCDLPQPVAAGVGVGYQDMILYLGGDNAQTYHQVEDLIFKASTTDNKDEKDDLISRKNVLQENHPGFSRKQLIFDISENTWRTIASDFPFEIPVTTTAILIDSDHIIIPSGEIKAGVRTEKIFIGRIIQQK